MRPRQTLYIVWLPTLLLALAVAVGVFLVLNGGRLFRSDPLDPEERAWLDARRGQITLGYDPGAEPVEFRDERGRFAGIVADYFRLLEQRLGLEFEVARFESWSDVVAAAEAGEIDVVAAMETTPERSEYLVFTRPYLSGPLVILMRRAVEDGVTLADLAGRKVAITRGLALDPELRRTHPEIDVVTVDDDLEGLLDVSLGRVDAVVTALATAGYLLEREGLTNLHVVGNAGKPVELRIGVRKDTPKLQQILDKGLESVTRAEHLEILQRWVPLARPRVFSTWEFWLSALAGLLVFSLALGTALAWNRALNRQVRQRTAELERDGAARVRAEAALDDRDQSMTSTLDRIHDAIVVTDGKGRIVRLNGAAEELAGSTTADAFGRPIGDVFTLVDPENRRPVASTIEDVLKSPDAVGFGSARLLLRDGSERRVMETGVSIRSRGGDVVGAVVALRDVSEEHALQEQLRDAHRLEALGQLAGGLAHDFNNLLAAIMGNAELVQLDADESNPNRVALDEIVKASKRAAGLTGQLLAFSSEGHVALEEADVHEVIGSVLAQLESELDRRVKLEWRPGAVKSVVRCEGEQLGSALRVVCDNAKAAMPAGGSLRVITSNVVPDRERLLRHPGLAPVAHLEIQISDTGVGMSAEVQAHIFEPFFSARRLIHATGLGLASAYGSIRSYGGAIEVESQVGEGSTFTILLPLAEERPAVPSRPDEIGEGRILVVDDDDGVRLLVSRVLGALGYEVATCSEGVQAIDFYRKHHGDLALVLLDLTMPRLSGQKVFERMREIDASVPVVVISGFVQSPKVHALLERGARGVLWKPFHIDELARMVHEVVTLEKSD